MQILSHLFDADEMRINLPGGMALSSKELAPLISNEGYTSKPSADEENGNLEMAQAMIMESVEGPSLAIFDIFSRYDHYEPTAETVSRIY
jgi:hypothetical protein